MPAIEHLLIFTQRYELGKRCLKTLQPLYKVSKQTKNRPRPTAKPPIIVDQPESEGLFPTRRRFSTSALQSGASTNPLPSKNREVHKQQGTPPRRLANAKGRLNQDGLPHRRAKVRTGMPRKRKKTFDPAQPLMTRTAAILPCPPSPAPHSEIADHDLFPQRDRRVYSRT